MDISFSKCMSKMSGGVKVCERAIRRGDGHDVLKQGVILGMKSSTVIKCRGKDASAPAPSLCALGGPLP